MNLFRTIGIAGIMFGLLPFHTAAQTTSASTPSQVRPDDNRFTPVPLTQPGALDEPLVFEILPDGRVYIAERKGTIKVYDPAIGGVKIAGTLAVNTKGNNEQGLVGLTFDPQFATNGWIYLYYYHPVERKAVFSRWETRADVLVANSEKVLLEWEAQRETCCHTGGGMTWDKDGNLYIAIGNNRGNTPTSQTDERPGRAAWDDQGGTANSNSLEGKILRIHPEPNGTYTIPKGNLFPPGTPRTRPEIYTLGHRNVWRVSIDSATGYVYWGEVGPDNREDSDRGPRGYDEYNQARGPGFFGWPYFVGDKAFPYWDYAAGKGLPPKDPLKPTNTSPNNTGITELPPQAPPFIAYHGSAMERFPALGTGGRCAIGGPIYHAADFKSPKRPWPHYFEGNWIVAEFSRRLILSVAMNPSGDFKSMERIVPQYRPVEPIDLKFGPDGDLYVLEYGGRWFQASPEAKLVRIEFEGGNRKPIAVASANKTGGVPPFDVQLSAAGTQDYDGDPLAYRWEIFAPGAPNPQILQEANPNLHLEATGAHVARLTVTDPSGASDSRSVSIVSGNEPPDVGVSVFGNQTYYFPETTFAYKVKVTDREDGTLESGKIPAERVHVSIDYVPEGFDLQSLKTLPKAEAAAARFPVAQALMTKGNCKACHLVEGKLVGPSFSDVARRYATDPMAATRLSQKAVTGGGGVWSPLAMPPNALITEAEAAIIVQYVLSLAETNANARAVAGSFTPELPKGDAGRGSVLIRAIYTDQGEEQATPLSGESIRLLRPAVLVANTADIRERTEPGQRGVTVKPEAIVGFKQVDLTAVRRLELTAAANGAQPGGRVEVHWGDKTGQLLGQATIAASPGTNAAPRNAPPKPILIPITETSETKDLFLVFKNETAQAETPLMNVSSVRLSAQSTPTAP